MSASRRLILGLAVLTSVSVGVLFDRVARRAWASVVDYAPPYRFADGEARGAPPLAERVFLVLIDGLRRDLSRQLPFLNRLREQGADLDCIAAVPSYSRPGRAALATGSWSDIHGATTNFHSRPVLVDNLFRSAARVGRSCALSGSDLWPSLFGVDLARCGGAVLPSRIQDEASHYARIMPEIREFERESVEFLKSRDASLRILDLVITDYASHEFGPSSEELRRAALESDRVLEALVGSLDLGKTALLVTSDHGHIDRGGHGGPEPQVLETPLVMAGQGIRRGVRGTARQIDVAPTIAALLGLPLPGAAEGRMLLEALDLTDVARVALLEGQWRQRAEFSRRYRAATGMTPDPTEKAPAPDAKALSEATAALDGRLEAARQAKIAAGRRSRLPHFLAILVVALLALVWWLRTAFPGKRRAMLLGLAVYGAAFNLLLRGWDMRVALSTLNHEEDLQPYFFKVGVFAFAAIVLALATALGAAALRSGATELWELCDLGLGVIGGVTCILGVWVGALYWRHGLLMRWHVPDLGSGFGSFVDLVQLQSVTYAAVLVPPLAWASRRLGARGPGRRPCL